MARDREHRQEQAKSWAEAQARAASIRLSDGRLRVYVVADETGPGATINVEPRQRQARGR